MKLSLAILLGGPLKKNDPDQWLNDDGSCGCAFGGALLAAGIGKEFLRERDDLITRGDIGFIEPQEYDCVRRLWPWLTEDHLGEITRLHRKVTRGGATLEQIADYVRSIEPQEDTQQFADSVVQDAPSHAGEGAHSVNLDSAGCAPNLDERLRAYQMQNRHDDTE